MRVGLSLVLAVSHTSYRADDFTQTFEGFSFPSVDYSSHGRDAEFLICNCTAADLEEMGNALHQGIASAMP